MNKSPEIVPILSIKYKELSWGGWSMPMNKWPKIVPTLSIKYIKYEVGGLKNLFAEEQKPKIVPTLASLCQHSRMDLDQQVTYFTRRMKWNNIFQKKLIVKNGFGIRSVKNRDKRTISSSAACCSLQTKIYNI